MTYAHCDCGLLISPDSLHVSAALQAILHVPHLRKFMANDVEHRRNCRSLVKCFICQLQNFIEELLKKAGVVGVIDASFFMKKWESLSCALPEATRKDPHEVLFLFLTRMRTDVVLRGKWASAGDFNASVINKIFFVSVLKNVSCNACGYFQKNMSFLSLTTDKFSDDFSRDVNCLLYAESTELCPSCCTCQAVLKTVEAALPSILIIHSRMCSPNFKWQGSIIVAGEKYEFLGCIVDLNSQPFYVNLCPDGKLRMFRNCKVTVISPATFFLAEYLVQAKLTLLYSKKENTSSNKTPTPPPRSQGRKNEFKVIGFPNMSMVDPEPSTKHRSTQTPAKKYCDVSTQTEKETVKKHEKKLLSYESCKTHKKFKFFTGLCQDDFEALYNLIGGDEAIRNLKRQYREGTPKKINESSISSKDRLFMLLLRLRRGLPAEELAFCFGISVSYACELCYVMTRLVYLTFKSMEKMMFVSAASQKRNQPKVMRPFKNLRVILDGMSIYIQTPSNFVQQGNTYSRYKSHNVLLFAIGISTHGATIFCSEGFEGSMSDKESIIQSGLLDMLEKGDGVMTDRGYEITAELQAKGCNFYKPPSLGNRKTFTPEEETLTKGIAAARIYTEHAIADIKDWRILQGVVPLNMLPVWSNIVYIAAYLRNFNPNRIKNKKFTTHSAEE